jgi:hypothetical protein
MTLLVILVVIVVALSVGVAVGRRRGPLVGIASGAGVAITGGPGYFAVLALSLPM